MNKSSHTSSAWNPCFSIEPTIKNQFRLWRMVYDIIDFIKFGDTDILNSILWSEFPKLDTCVRDYICRSQKYIDVTDFIDNHLVTIIIRMSHLYFTEFISEDKLFLNEIVKNVKEFSFYEQDYNKDIDAEAESLILDMNIRKILYWNDIPDIVLEILSEGWLRLELKRIGDIDLVLYSEHNVKYAAQRFTKWVTTDFLPWAIQSLIDEK